MCMQCVAAGSTYVVPALVGLRVWAVRRGRATGTDGSLEPPVEPSEEPAGAPA